MRLSPSSYFEVRGRGWTLCWRPALRSTPSRRSSLRVRYGHRIRGTRWSRNGRSAKSPAGPRRPGRGARRADPLDLLGVVKVPPPGKWPDPLAPPGSRPTPRRGPAGTRPLTAEGGCRENHTGPGCSSRTGVRPAIPGGDKSGSRKIWRAWGEGIFSMAPERAFGDDVPSQVGVGADEPCFFHSLAGATWDNAEISHRQGKQSVNEQL